MSEPGGTPAWEIAIARWAAQASRIPNDRVRWADRSSEWPAAKDGPWLSLRVLGDDASMAYVEYRRRTWSFSPIAVTAVDAGAARLTIGRHSMNDGDGPVRLVGDQPPGELESGVDYWAIRGSATQIMLAASFVDAVGREAIDITSAGALPLHVAGTPRSVRAGGEAEQVTMEDTTIEVSIQCRGANAYRVMQQMRVRGQVEHARDLLAIANVGLVSTGGLQNLGAARDAGSYEPRFAMSARFAVVLDPHIDIVSIIERYDIEGTLRQE